MPVQAHLQAAIGKFADAHVVDRVQGARQRRGRGSLAGAQAEYAILQPGAVGVVDQRHLAFRILRVDMLGIPLRQVEFTVRIEQLQIGIPILGIAEL
ncbi:hypothetical protein D9M72_634290 [compost metagenome]